MNTPPSSSQELISALSDGECTAAELSQLLAEMERDAALKQAYSRRVLLRDAVAGVHIARGQGSICEGVMARLGSEPMAEPGTKLVDLDSRRRWLMPFSRAGALAAAASVAAVAVLVAMPGLRPGSEAPGAAPTLAGAAVAGNTMPVAAPAPRRARDLRVASYTPEQTEQMDELNALLIQHSHGAGGTLRHARFAAQSQQQPQLHTAEGRR